MFKAAFKSSSHGLRTSLTIDPDAFASAGRSLASALLIVIAAAILTLGVFNYPLGSVNLIVALSLYACLIVTIPRAPLILIPALLPVLDLAPLTGRFFLDEFDLLLLTTFIMANCRAPTGHQAPRMPRIATMLLSLFVFSALIAAVRGMLPLSWPDLNSFNNYFSPLNGLRSIKGLIWSLLAIPLLRRELQHDPSSTHRLFGIGMLLGVAAVSVVVVWERLAFAGLFNFNTSYRIVGAFSAMHNGGASIEAYLVLALPFVAWRALVEQRWPLRLFSLAIFVLGSYCMMVTFARGGYVALVFGMLAFAAAIPLTKSIVLRPPQAVILVMLFVLMSAVAIPVMKGGTMKGRFSTSQRDLSARAAHWMQAMKMMDSRPETTLLGIGSGRYPALTFLSTSHEMRPASYRFENDLHNTWLKLGPGLPLYFEQVVTVKPKQRYHVSFSARGEDDEAIVAVPVCEKWLLYSATCFSESIVIGDTDGRWKKFEIDFDTDKLDSRPWYAARPIKLALVNEGSSSFDIDNVSMMSNGVELIRNGSFSETMDQWFFSVDNFEVWHFENTWLQLYFEQGATGLLLFVLLMGATIRYSATRLREAEFPLPPLGSAILGFLALGMIDSLFDFPRLAFLFFTALFFILLKPQCSTISLSKPASSAVR